MGKFEWYYQNKRNYSLFEYLTLLRLFMLVDIDVYAA